MNYIRPTFSTGFAHNAGEALYPFFWKGLIGAWCPSLGKQGDKLYDFSGNKQHCTLTNFAFSGATSNYVSGKYGWALDYDGTNDLGDCGRIRQLDYINTNNRGLTVSFWMKSSTSQTSHAIITYDNNSSLSPSIDMYIMLKTNLTVGGFLNDSELDTGFPQTSLTDGKWHHVCIVGKLLNVKTYIDGKQVNSQTGVGAVNDWSGAGFALQFSPAENVSRYVGSLGDIFIWDRDLSAKEVSLLAAGISPLTPAMMSMDGFFAGNATVLADVLTGTSSVLAPTLVIDATVNITEQTATSSVLDPIAGATVTFLASELDATASVQAPAFQIDATFIATILSAIASVQDPIVPQDVIINPTVISATSSQVTPAFVGESLTFAAFGTRILSLNPLIFVTNTSPARIVVADTTIPTALTWEVAALTGIDSAVDASLDSTAQFVYVAGANGKVVKVDVNLLTSQTVIDLSDTDDLLHIRHFDSQGVTVASTENVIGELYLIDERTAQSIDTDLRVIIPVEATLDTDFALVEGETIDTDLQVLAYNTAIMNCDLKCLTQALDTITPIKRLDFKVYVDNVLLSNTDVDLSSIRIVHTVDNKSTADFTLTRRHDRLNQDLAGNTRTITSQNTVKITIDDIVEFEGKISNLDCKFNTVEQVDVTAVMEQPVPQYNQVLLSLPTLNQRLSLYDILIQNPKITNPYMDNRLVLKGANNQYWTGSAWTRTKSSALTFTSYLTAQDYIDDSTNTTFTNQNPFVENYEENPSHYKGVVVNLGEKIQQKVLQYFEVDSFGSDAERIQNGTFAPKQNWTYFWSPKVRKFANLQVGQPAAPGAVVARDFLNLSPLQLTSLVVPPLSVITDLDLGNTQAVEFLYIGTSLSPVSAGNWRLERANRRRQRIYDDKVTQLGYYTIGTAPFKSISTSNGIKITKNKWEDRENGLFSVREAGYNYENFAKMVAALEYQKLANINGDIAPETSCSLQLTIDAYYYFGLKLLTRINIDNTTEAGIYNNNNGFPVAVKSITISSGDMSVILLTDNAKSTEELEALDGLFPNPESPEFVTPEKVIEIVPKTDLNTLKTVE